MTASGPRLLRHGEAPTPAGARGAAPLRDRRLLPLALGALLLALAYGVHEARRAARFEDRAAELALSLRAAEAELAAHRRHLDVIRRTVADVRQRMDALQSLADQAPPAPSPESSPAP